MGDDKGQEVDIHSYTFDDHGKVVFGVEYPLDSLTEPGSIQGYQVKCISVEWMVKLSCWLMSWMRMIIGLAALCERFGIALPDEYKKIHLERGHA